MHFAQVNKICHKKLAPDQKGVTPMQFRTTDVHVLAEEFHFGAKACKLNAH